MEKYLQITPYFCNGPDCMTSSQKFFIQEGTLSGLLEGMSGRDTDGTGASERTHFGLLVPTIVKGILIPVTESSASLPASEEMNGFESSCRIKTSLLAELDTRDIVDT